MIYKAGTLIQHKKGYTEVADGTTNYSSSAWSVASGSGPSETENSNTKSGSNGNNYVPPVSQPNRNIEAPVLSNPTPTETRVNNNSNSQASTLYEYYTGQGQALPSRTERAKLFESLGLGSAAEYSGTSNQNTILLQKLKAGGSGAGASSDGSGVGSGSSVSQDEIRANMATIQQKLAAAQARLKAANDAGITGNMEIPDSITGTAVDENEARKKALEKINANLEQFQLDQAKEETTSKSYLKTIEDLEMPETPDYAAQYAEAAKQAGLDAAQGELTAVETQIAEMEGEAKKAMGLETKRMAPQSVINLRKAKLGEEFDDQLQTLYDKKAVIQNSIALKTDTVNNIMALNRQSYTDALNTYTTSLQKYEMMYSLLEAEEDEEYDRTQQEQKTAQTNLAILQDNVSNFVKSGGSFESLPESMKTQIRTLELQAGLPEGTTEQLTAELEPEEEIFYKQASKDGTRLSVMVRNSDGTFTTKLYDTGLTAEPDDNGLTPGQIQSAVSSIVGQFDNEAVVKNYNIVSEGYQFAKSLGEKEEPTSSDDQGLLYAFAKAMDPNSVVREGEYATVQKYAQSWAETFGFNTKRIYSNTPFLSDEARTNMIETIRSKYNVSEKNYQNIANEYNRRISDAKQGVISGSITDYSKAYEEDNDSGSEATISDVDDTIYSHANDYQTREQLIEAIFESAPNIGRDKIASRVYTLIPDK